MTTQLTITIEESVLNAIGKTEVEKSLQAWLTRLQIQAAAKEILEDLPDYDLTNDPEWQTARELAWMQEKLKYVAQ